MPFYFSFRDISGTRAINQAVNFLARQSLGYPNYADWIEKAETELLTGIKKGVIAYNNGILAGDVICQSHKDLSEELNVLELKNIRIHPEVRGRRFASFMLRQAEIEFPHDLILVDARKDQMDMINFLLSEGYKPIASSNLYEPGVSDIVMAKVPRNRQNLIPELRNYFQSITR